jgi:orotidine-5'-phosphate decarboxylase
MSVEEARDRLIVAMDFSRADDALRFDAELGEEIRWVKVGLELFTAGGVSVASSFKDRGRRVFLDLKLHDIPNTVEGAIRVAAGHGVDLLTLHAEGGPGMMEAARRARDESGSNLRLLAITVLTSLDGSEFPDVYRSQDIRARVRAFTAGAVEAGMDGVVCSSLELDVVTETAPEGFLRVTPGIRPAGVATDDQARIGTPLAALRAGATHLVVGRAITRSDDPHGAVRGILEEMDQALNPSR